MAEIGTGFLVLAITAAVVMAAAAVMAAEAVMVEEPAKNCKELVVLVILLAVILTIVVHTVGAVESALSVHTIASAMKVGPVIVGHADQLRFLLMLQEMAST